MSDYGKGTETGTRENRLGSITGYEGTLQGLGQACGGGGFGDRKRCFSQASLCNAACALGQLGFVTDAAVVHHSPSGCAVTAMSLSNSKDQLAAKLGLDNSRSGYVSTDMNEADTVFGATENLRDVVRETHRRYDPRAIFIGASCVSGVIGEDLASIARETSEELGIPVAPVFCEGFKTQIWASGFDAAFHAILSTIVQPPKVKRDVVNVINFFGSARKEITALFALFGVEPLFLLSNTTIEQLSQLSESVATVSTCATLGTYLGHGLEEQYGVPYIKSLQPHGMAGFESWVRGLAKVLGKDDIADAYLKKEKETWQPKIEAFRAKLTGLRAVVGMGPGFNFNTTRVLQELGLEIVHSAAWHFDKQYEDGRRPESFQYLLDHSPNDFPLSVNDLQNFELLNILNTVKPDIFFSRHTGSTVWATKLGIPSLCVFDEYAIFGYHGLVKFASAVHDVVTNRSFTKNLASRVKLPYTGWWFAQPHHNFLEAGEPA